MTPDRVRNNLQRGKFSMENENNFKYFLWVQLLSTGK